MKKKFAGAQKGKGVKLAIADRDPKKSLDKFSKRNGNIQHVKGK